MINTNSLTQARKEIQELKKSGKEVVVLARDSNFNRKILENEDVDILIGVEFSYDNKKTSGLNEVLCKLAKKNNIKIGVDIGKINKLDKIEKARILTRVIKNIYLCRKTGAK